MTTLIVLASEGLGHKTWWNPYVKGGMIALLAVALFTGSAYLLLYTNVGTRLGFLLTAAAFSGFFAVLTVFWITGQFPNGPLGKEPGWPVKELVDEPSQSRYEAVRTIEDAGDEAESADAGQIRASLDEQLVAEESRFKLFAEPADFVTEQTFTTGGGRKWPFWWSEKTTYGATEICPAADVEVLPLEAPPPAECAAGEPTQWVVVVKDLGARRLPAFLFFSGSSILFALSLLALRRYEREIERPPSASGDAEGGEGGGPPEGGGEPAPEPEPEPAAV